MINRNFRAETVAARAVLSVITFIALSGCGSRPETTRGAALPAVAISNVVQLTQVERTKPVLLRGEMIDKCPVAGCWFMLRDKTGIVRVDTKAAGFVVSDVPLHTRRRTWSSCRKVRKRLGLVP